MRAAPAFLLLLFLSVDSLPALTFPLLSPREANMPRWCHCFFVWLDAAGCLNKCETSAVDDLSGCVRLFVQANSASTRAKRGHALVNLLLSIYCLFPFALP